MKLCFLLLMYPYFRFKLLSVILTNLCLGNDFIFKSISLSVMVSCLKSYIVLWPMRISILIMIHANHLQVQSHLARGDVISARIASAEAKNYALIAVCIGIVSCVFIVLFQTVFKSTVGSW